MGKSVVAVCTEEQDYAGRHWLRGQVWDGPDSDFPVGPGWAQREPRPDETSPIHDTLSSGRSTVGWAKPYDGPPRLTEPKPVMTFDLLRGPQVDEQATADERQRVDEINNRLLPKQSNVDHWQQHLRYLEWAAPEQYAAWIAEHPEDALSAAPQPVMPFAPPAPGQVPVSLGEIRKLGPIPPEGPDTSPAATPDDLGRLLEEEVQAQREGNAEKLAEIRKQIEAALK